MKTSYLSPTAWLSEASRDGLGNRFWIDTRLLSVKVKCPDPGVASHDQKPDRGIVSGIKSPPLARTPPPPHGIYIDRCIIPLEILNELSKASSTRIRKFVKTQSFYEYGLRPHVSSVFSCRIRKFLKKLSRVEIFLSDTNTYTCGRSYPEICEYAFVILLDPVFTASIINKNGVQQDCSFFVSCSDF